jgi:hypothetical protein
MNPETVTPWGARLSQAVYKSGYSLDDRRSGVRFVTEIVDSSLVPNVRSDLCSTQPPIRLVPGGSFPRNKAAGA